MNNTETSPISGVNISVTKIEILDNDSMSIGNASGFFFRHNGIKYLITNRHVVIDENEDFYPKYLKIKLHTNKENPRQNIDIRVNLYEDSKPNWLEHKDYNEKEIDVIALPLNKLTIEKTIDFDSTIINFFSQENFLNNYTLSTFSNVIIVGYPLGFHDESNNLPVYRKGMVASSFKVDFEGDPYFLIDSNLHEGTSGSPVINSPHNLIIDNMGNGIHTQKYILLGVHSAEHIVDKDPLGLNVVWYPRVIIEIIENN
ncbi:serine protease [Mangrovivirga sp. M17]|uniref:Serine protease n=1 Tax=Mangrovivirga halotolerans TaxID=2993936 RepID=A0ABT3RXG2_9BACT|nr:serine protease [Mangrovivirga halotolerans]MCX2745825.1 serine protease [Mangrovivirga halotolerans]